MISSKALILSILFSSFLYLEYFDISIKLINTIFTLSGFILILTLTKKELFQSGFIIGVLWFWWLSLSFIHYDLTYLIPLILIGIGLFYGVLFYLIGLFKNLYLKVLVIFLISFLEPFGFNWFKIELLLVNTYFGISKIELLILLMLSALLIQYYKNNLFRFLYTISLLLLYFYNYSQQQYVVNDPQLKIYQYNTNIDQNIKWKSNHKSTIINDNFVAIKDAIKNQYDLIILPETAFPLVLNKKERLVNNLLHYSKDISILTGALYYKNKKLYNSSYLFQDQSYKVANKVVLVPFGEAVPLPEKIRDFINNTFYNGAKDYHVATTPTTFDIKGKKFRNSICYEATTDEIFKNLDTQYIISISNNAWFTPSIQPTLQKLLMKYYSLKYKVTYYNVSNS